MISGLQALGNRDYRTYALGGVVSNLGTWMQRIAQDWLVLLVSDNNGVILGVATALQFAPTLLLAPFAGRLADSYDRRRLLQITQGAMAAVSLVLGVLALTQTLSTGILLALVCAFGVASAFDAPVRHAFVGTIVSREDLPSAVAINSISFNSARAVGAAVSGGLIGLLGSNMEATGIVIVLNALSYVPVIISLSRLTSNTRERTARMDDEPAVTNSALSYLRGSRTALLVLAATATAALFGLNLETTSALMVTKVFRSGAEQYGGIAALTAVGALAGAFAASRRRTPGLLLLFSALLSLGVVEVVAGMSVGPWMFMVLAPLLGFASMTTLTTANTMMQLGAPSAIRGRVMGAYNATLTGGNAAGGFMLGAVAQAWSPRDGLVIGGALVAIIGLIGGLVVWQAGGQGAAAR